MVNDFNSGMDFVTSSLKSESHKRTYRCCFKRLQEYLSSNNKNYSLAEAVAWLELVKARYSKKCFSEYRTAVYRLDEYLTTGQLNTPRRMLPFDGAPKYARLSQESRQLLDDALAVTNYYGTGKNSFRIAVSDFLFYVDSRNITSNLQTPYSLLKEYLMNLKRIWPYNAYRDRLNYIFSFMSFIKNGMESDLFSAYHGNSLMFFTEELDDEIQAQINEIQSNAKKSSEAVIAAYDKVYFVLKEKVEAINPVAFKKYKARWNSFFLFLTLNELSISEEMVAIWHQIAGANSTPLLRNIFPTKNTETKNIYLLSSHAGTPEKTESRKFSLLNPRVQPEDNLQHWSSSLLTEYLDIERKRGKAETTIQTQRYACVKFLTFVEQSGIQSCEEITPQLLIKYNIWDKHKTNEGKKCYNSRISRFVKYLGETGRVPQSLYLGLPCKVAPQVRTVKILNETEIKAIYEAKSEAKTPIALRDAAIVMLGLRMGLRAGDIVSIRFCDIDWRKQVLHITQNKTGKSLLLPIPTEVGNSIFRYIKDGRPKSLINNIFVSHKAPFGNLPSDACADSLNRMLMTSSFKKQPYGFHITRKTFASRLLQSGNSVDSVVNLLGHDGNHTVMKYLATDDTKMRMCAISAGKLVSRND